MSDKLPVLLEDINNAFTPEELKHGIDVSEIDLNTIYQFIDRGDRADAPKPIIVYLSYMEKIRCMDQRRESYGNRDMVVKHLIKVNKLSPYLANRLYDDAVEYFYSDRNISRDAHRNRLAEMMMKNISLATAAAKDAKDVIAINKSILDVAKVLKLDEPDPIKLDESTPEPWVIFTADAETLGLPKVNRSTIAKQIDAIPDISEKKREHIKREAGVLPVKIFVEQIEDSRED